MKKMMKPKALRSLIHKKVQRIQKEDSAENAEEQDNAIADALEKAAKDEDKFEEELAEAEKEQDEEEASIHID